MICERCNCETLVTTMSWFNTEIVCLNCKEKEKLDPDYKVTREIELFSLKPFEEWKDKVNIIYLSLEEDKKSLISYKDRIYEFKNIKKPEGVKLDLQRIIR